MMFKRAAAAAAASAAAAATVAGCSSAPDLTYAPAAYGVSGHCYYVDDPAEAFALRAAGLCPASWLPTLMPVAWHEMYYGFYDSPAYYDTYVPARARTVYVRHEVTFNSAHRTDIAKQSKNATYKSSAGKTVKGSQVAGKVKFGSGTSFGSSKYGGGSLRSSGSSGSGTSKPGSSKSGSSGYSSSRSGSSGSGSSRSGSLRSGSSGSSRSHK